MHSSEMLTHNGTNKISALSDLELWPFDPKILPSQIMSKSTWLPTLMILAQLILSYDTGS